MKVNIGAIWIGDDERRAISEHLRSAFPLASRDSVRAFYMATADAEIARIHRDWYEKKQARLKQHRAAVKKAKGVRR